MANNKSLLNSSFKDTIKMTLTSDGNLGVGLINPNYKITATGVIQSKSTLAYVVNDFPWKVGLDTWKDDVHLSLGVSNDGLNTGVIQVTSADISYNGTAFQDSPYNLLIQPGGGNVGIGIQVQPAYPLHVQGEIKTNTIVRADVDFTTGTDTPGWSFYPSSWSQGVPGNQIPHNASLSATSAISMISGSYGNAGNPTVAGDRLIKYKIIGKTVHLFVIFRDVNHGNSECEGFRIPLPSFLWPASYDGTTTLGSYQVRFKQQFGTGIYSGGSPTYDKILRCDLMKVSSGTPTDHTMTDWHLFIRNAYRGGDAFASAGWTDPLYGVDGTNRYYGLGAYLTKLSKYFYGSSRPGGTDIGTISVHLTYDLM